MCHVALGLLDRILEFGCELQIVFNDVIEPFTNLTKFRLRQLTEFRFHLLYFAHNEMIDGVPFGFKREKIADCTGVAGSDLNSESLREEGNLTFPKAKELKC